jgi:hypothetical protein
MRCLRLTYYLLHGCLIVCREPVLATDPGFRGELRGFGLGADIAPFLKYLLSLRGNQKIEKFPGAGPVGGKGGHGGGDVGEPGKLGRLQVDRFDSFRVPLLKNVPPDNGVDGITSASNPL